MWPFHRHDWKEINRIYTPDGIRRNGFDSIIYRGPMTMVHFQCKKNILHFKTKTMDGDFRN